MASDRIFGLVVILVALAYIASALQIQASFLSDPVGSKTFPIGVGVVAILCGLSMLYRPDPDPDWPAPMVWGKLAFALAALVAYAFFIRPLGFLIPTALVAGVLSYQINPNASRAVMAGLGLSVGLYVVFKFALGLGLVALPAALAG